jgi:Domain of unknown function (DUF6457)
VDEWLVELAAALGTEPADPGEIAELLDVARDVAHGVERKATPIATFLLGLSVQRRVDGGASRAEALDAALTDLRRAMLSA